MAPPPEAVTVTLYGPFMASHAATVPEMTPAAQSMDSPFGRPLALKLSVSAALSETSTGSETASPSALVWSPGLVTDRWATSQVSDVLAESVASEAVMVTA